MTRFSGNVFRFAANVTTDDILPGKYLDRRNDEVGSFAMAGLDDTFARRVKPSDMIVAGDNFGMGSGRESAPMAIKLSGVAAVLAPSFSRLFYRNAINLGLPAIIVDGVSLETIEAGDRIAVDLTSRSVVVERTGALFPIRNLSGIPLAILQAGGIVAFTKKRVAGEDSPGSCR